MKKKNFSKLFIIVFICINGFIISAHANTTEEIFEQAKNYTIQIRTSVEIPFDSDEEDAGLGAGFLIDKSRGWAITNAHVVTRSVSTITVAPNKGDFHTASKIYVDPYIDLAVIKIPTKHIEKLTEAKLDCDNNPKIGHPVGAFGHPWGLSYTGTRGIISGNTAKFGSELLQTDAPINGGNSGGPLISLTSGKVLAINTASFNSEEDQNTNFATPINYVCKILTLLKEGKDPSPPKLMTIFSETLNDNENLTVAKTYLQPDLLDLQTNDVIVSANGNNMKISNEGQLVHQLRGNAEDVTLSILRDGEQRMITGMLELMEKVLERKALYVSGIVLREKAIRDVIELGSKNQIIATYVDSSSIGQSLEIEEWDIIDSIDHKSISSLEHAYSLLKTADNNEHKAHIVLRRWSSKENQIYDYLSRKLPIHNLKMINDDRENNLVGVVEPN